MRKHFNTTNILFILLMGLYFIPSRLAGDNYGYVLALVIIMEISYLFYSSGERAVEQIQARQDITNILFLGLFSWQVLTGELNIMDKMLFPPPGVVIAQFISDLPELAKGLAGSLMLLLSGFGLALVSAVPLAILIGWKKRLYNAIMPLTKVLGPIPPIVYIPYAIALLPTFRVSSIFIIFVGAFWPIFINTLKGVSSVERRIIESAKVLNVKESTMLFEVILPASLPAIFSGATLGLVMSFILLTAAEMIGASSGLGWYVKYYSDFADYPRVAVGILFIGLVVTGIMVVFEKIENHLLRWRRI